VDPDGRGPTDHDWTSRRRARSMPHRAEADGCSQLPHRPVLMRVILAVRYWGLTGNPEVDHSILISGDLFALGKAEHSRVRAHVEALFPVAPFPR
jgi:hypothetical protein